MAGTSTVYDVKVRYAMDDKASKGMATLANQTDRAAKSAGSLKGTLAAIGGFAVLKTAKSALIDFNSELDQMKIGMTAVMQMQLKMPFEKARIEADKLFKTFQEMAKKSPATTKDFMTMASAIAPTVAMLGGGPNKIAKLAQGGVLASTAFGERSDIVARDIKQLLTGNVTDKDPLAMQLLGARGINKDDFNDNSKTNPQQRAQLVESMLQDPALLKAADRMGDSFAGQTAAFKDELQIALGQVGLPLVKSLTAEFKKINKWVSEHPRLIKEWVTTFGEGIKNSFEFVKSIAGWLIDNRDVLMSMAKVFLTFKGAQMAGNLIHGAVKGIESFASSIRSGVTMLNGEGGFKGLLGSMGGASGFIAKISAATGALGLLATGATALFKLLDNERNEKKKLRDSTITMREAVGDTPEKLARKREIEQTLKGDRIGPDARARLATELDNIKKDLMNPEKLGMMLRKLDEGGRKAGGRGFKDWSVNDFMGYGAINNGTNSGAGGFARAISDGQNTYTRDKKVMQESAAAAGQMKRTFEVIQSALYANKALANEILQHAFPEQYGMPKPAEVSTEDKWNPTAPTAPKIDVTIQRVEVASEDPDRFVFGLVRVADQAIKHKTQSQHSIPGGF